MRPTWVDSTTIIFNTATACPGRSPPDQKVLALLHHFQPVKIVKTSTLARGIAWTTGDTVES